ncbi:MAG: hypothetical protein HOD92_14055 [Deltaproteobacteria bacterium]|nr:hypothetical protein [Deltaproteobacteria bacterium]
MTEQDLILLSNIFKTPTLNWVTKECNKLSKQERLHISKVFFELTGKLFSTILEPNINDSFSEIYENVEQTFFENVYTNSQILLNNKNEWRKKVSILRNISLFSDLSTYDLISISENIQEKQLDADEAFLVQYELVEGVYILEENVKIYEYDQANPITTRNGIFGDDACATGDDYSFFTARVVKDCTAYFIPRKEFLNLISRIPDLQQEIFQTIANRAIRSSKRAEEQKRLTKEILENVGQGSFSINHAGEIGENYTSNATEYLGQKNLAGVPFADLVFQKDREALRNYYRALHLMFSNNQFDPDLVLDLLPHEVTVNQRIFKLNYSFIQDNMGNVLSVFIRMEDLTRQREIEAQEAKEKIIQEKIQQNIGGFLNMLDEVKNVMNTLKNFEKNYIKTLQKPQSNELRSLMRVLHGSKGLSGQFDLDSLKTALHGMEDCIQMIGAEGVESQIENFSEHLKTVKAGYNYGRDFKKNLGSAIIEILQGITFSKEEFERLQTDILKGNIEAVKAKILAKNSVSASAIIDNWAADIQKLANNLDKKIDFFSDIAEEIQIPKKLANMLNNELAHLYRNSVDHGIESVEERKKQGKFESGMIRIEVKQVSEQLNIVLEDDGKGLNEAKIKEKALANKNLDQAQVQKMISTNKCWRILFLPGFSTAENVTSLSGRGVGMDAVYTAIQELNGLINMESVENEGITTKITIPI